MPDNGLPPRPLASDFLLSAASLGQCPDDDVPEVAFVGRSNVGKSSTLNRLTGRRQLARVSKTPGRTQLINLFTVHDGGRLVDLPGYGYARAAKSRRAVWSQAVNDYLNGRGNLVGVVLVMDIRHPLRASDQGMIEWCRDRSMPLLVLLNKADKLKRGARAQTRHKTQANMPPNSTALLFSAVTGLGTDEVVAALRAWLEPKQAASREA